MVYMTHSLMEKKITLDEAEKLLVRGAELRTQTGILVKWVGDDKMKNICPECGKKFSRTASLKTIAKHNCKKED